MGTNHHTSAPVPESDKANTTLAQRLIQRCKWDVMVVGPLIGLRVSLSAVVVARFIDIADV